MPPLARLLRDNDIEPTIVELNLDTVRRLQAEGTQAVYGDAMHRVTIQTAGIDRAVALLLTSSGMRGAQEVIRLAREANPKVRVFARTGYLRDLEVLQRAGADAAFSGEGEVALTMTEFVLRRLGAPEEQIDRERDRVRTELFEGMLSGEPLLGTEEHSSAAVADETVSTDGAGRGDPQQDGTPPPPPQQEQTASDPTPTPPA